jgi:hypothetical protein
MNRITIYHHPDCDRCRRIARAHRAFDWLGRVRTSTDVPPTGPLRLGEIAVEDVRTGETIRGVDAVRTIARNIPAYLPLLPLLRVPPIARWVDREVRGCSDGSCSVPAPKAGGEAARRA